MGLLAQDVPAVEHGSIGARRGLGPDEEDTADEAKWREACVFRARVVAAAQMQAQREAVCPERAGLPARARAHLVL